MREGVCIQIGLGHYPEYIYLVEDSWHEVYMGEPEARGIHQSVFQGVRSEGWKFYGIDCDPHSIAHVSGAFQEKGYWILAYVSGSSETFQQVDSLEFRDNAPDNMFIPIVSFAGILDHFRISDVDVLAMDIEGAEIEFFETYDWKVKPIFISVEVHSFNMDLEEAFSRIADCLRRQNYRVVGKIPFVEKVIEYPTLEAKFLLCL